MDAKHRWRVQNTRMQTGYVPSNYVRKEKPSIFDSIKKKVSFFNEKREQVVSPFFLSQVKGGGNQGAGSRTLPSSNSSPVHSVPPPPHTSKIILPLIKVGEILIFFMNLLSNVTLYYVWTATNESFLHNTISTTIFSIPLLHLIPLLLRYEIFGQPATNHYRKLGANILGNCEIQLPGKKVAADLDFQLVWILADRSAKIFSSCQIQLPGIYGT